MSCLSQRGWAPLLLAALLCLFHPSGARATPDSDYELAARRAVKALSAGYWAEAEHWFMRAHALSPRANALRGQALAVQKQDRPVEARALFEAALRCELRPLKGDVREGTRAMLADIESQLGRYEFVLTPAHSTLQLDGTAISPVQAAWITEGKHTLTATANGYVSEVRVLMVRGGARERLVMALEPAAADSPVPQARQPKRPPTEVTQRPGKPQPTSTSTTGPAPSGFNPFAVKRRRTWGLDVLLGTGVVIPVGDRGFALEGAKEFRRGFPIDLAVKVTTPSPYFDFGVKLGLALGALDSEAYERATGQTYSLGYLFNVGPLLQVRWPVQNYATFATVGAYYSRLGTSSSESRSSAEGDVDVDRPYVAFSGLGLEGAVGGEYHFTDSFYVYLQANYQHTVWTRFESGFGSETLDKTDASELNLGFVGGMLGVGFRARNPFQPRPPAW